MVFRIRASLRFATAPARTAGRTTINSAIAGRDTTVIADTDADHPERGFLLFWEAEEANTGDAGTIYALIQAMTSPLAGSMVNHHTCWHGDNADACLLTAAKAW